MRRFSMQEFPLSRLFCSGMEFRENEAKKKPVHAAQVKNFRCMTKKRKDSAAETDAGEQLPGEEALHGFRSKHPDI